MPAIIHHETTTGSHEMHAKTTWGEYLKFLTGALAVGGVIAAVLFYVLTPMQKHNEDITKVEKESASIKTELEKHVIKSDGRFDRMVDAIDDLNEASKKQTRAMEAIWRNQVTQMKEGSFPANKIKWVPREVFEDSDDP